MIGVLVDLHAGHGPSVHRYDPVPGKQSGPLGGSAGYHADDDGCILRHVECHTDAVEVAFQLGIGLLETLGRQVDRVRIEFTEYKRQDILGHLVIVYAVHIVLLYLLQHQLYLVPAVAGLQHGLTLCPTVREIGNDSPGHEQNQGPEDVSKYLQSVRFRHGYSISYLQTSIPAMRISSIPSRTLYSIRYTTRLIPAWMMSLAHSMQGASVT